MTWLVSWIECDCYQTAEFQTEKDAEEFAKMLKDEDIQSNVHVREVKE